MRQSLAPATRRLVGLLTIVGGGLMMIAYLIRLALDAYTWPDVIVANSPFIWRFVADVLFLISSTLVVRYGWRIRRDGHVSDEPGNGAIT